MRLQVEKDLIRARREEEDEIVVGQALLRQKWANYPRVDDMSASGGALCYTAGVKTSTRSQAPCLVAHLDMCSMKSHESFHVSPTVGIECPFTVRDS